ncbi:MAG TPA: SAM-dependent methyltransferase, partial [Flavobacteriaceae bacterium]|nr:SAM-dependent methyltransferase [Flavobacteriaceae bacterium]
MSSKTNYLEINRTSWNARTTHHITSEFYDVKGFLEGNTSLKSIELELLGDVKG